MSEIIDFIGNIGGVLGNFIELIKDIFTTLGSMLVNGFSFMKSIVTTIPNVLINSIFSSLPPVFKYGLTGLVGIFVFIFVLKLFSLIKFW